MTILKVARRLLFLKVAWSHPRRSRRADLVRRSPGRSSAFRPLSAAPFAPSGDHRRGLPPVRRNLTIPKGFRIYSTVAFGA
jgi:hypothetical protein